MFASDFSTKDWTKTHKIVHCEVMKPHTCPMTSACQCRCWTAKYHHNSIGGMQGTCFYHQVGRGLPLKQQQGAEAQAEATYEPLVAEHTKG